MKTVMVDDSKIVSDMLMTICARIGQLSSSRCALVVPPQVFCLFCVSMRPLTFCSFQGITNYDEYSLVRDIGEEKKEETMGTLRKDRTLLKDDKKMEKLKQKLHTDDECTADCLPSH